ncbi:MAG: ABC transporter permease [Candidatus Eremiobacteraeota bacterium]|nr:ABC transporter permease [Candidatus Eremiobacteraeota bacterium]
MIYLARHLPLVAQLTAQHLFLVFVSLLVACAIAFPLAVVALRRPLLERVLGGALSALYTVPSLALLAVLVRYAGLGFVTAIVTLVAYAQFVLVQTTIAALRDVSPALREAAAAMGMTENQRFWRVEVPVAFPVILGGIRIALVTLIALATLTAYAGAGGLGSLIFEGLSRTYPQETLAGSIPAALLAIIADVSLRGVERTLRR